MIFDLKNVRLGKQAHQYDQRTLMLSTFIDPEITSPPTFDFDKTRRKIPISMFGNDMWGNCVKVGQANHMIRMERLEQRRTLPLKDYHVIEEYQKECGRQFGHSPKGPGDPDDNGLVVLKNMRNWRNAGWTLDFTKKPSDERNYTIAAYGELEPNDNDQLRVAMYLFHGIHLGISLPLSAQRQTRQGFWNVSSGPDAVPGSWGGHLVYAKRYDQDSIYVLTWGQEIKVTNAFIRKYTDEAWAVVDNLNSWRKSNALDVDALVRTLRQIGASVGD